MMIGLHLIKSDYFTSSCLMSLISILIIIKWWMSDWRRKRNRFLMLTQNLPGPQGYPLIGNGYRVIGCNLDNLLGRLVELVIPYRDISPMKLYLGPHLYIVVTKPEDIEVILNSQETAVKGLTYEFLYPFIGEGLISGSGNVWKGHRKMVLRTLGVKSIRKYVKAFDNSSKIMVETMKKFADGNIFNIHGIIDRCTINIVCETIMGCADIDHDEKINRDFFSRIERMYHLIYERMLKIWLHPNLIYKMTKYHREQMEFLEIRKKFMTRFIDRIRYGELNTDRDKYSILEQIIEINNSSKELSDTELIDEMSTIYSAAQDTVSSISSFAILMLAMYPIIQEKSRDEAKDFFTNQSMTYESLDRLKYIDMVIKETLRLFPIAPFQIRHVKKELSIPNCTLPENCQVLIASFVTQRSPQYWTNPEKFIPERFLPEYHSKRHPFTFFPFSSGPMSCIGQKFAMICLKAIITHILLNFKITTTIKMEDIKLRADISIRAVNGYYIALHPL